MIAVAFLGFCVSEVVEIRLEAAKQNDDQTSGHSVYNWAHPDMLEGSSDSERTPLMRKDMLLKRHRWKSLILKYMI